MEDYARSYEIDGIMWGSERQGALCNGLGANHGDRPIDPGNVTCFCEFCQRKAKERGINVERARQGFLGLEKFVRAARGGKRPVDGYYVQFWRLLLRYPELLPGKCCGPTVLRETYDAIYKTVKAAKPQTCRSAGTSGTTILSTRSTAPSRTFWSFQNIRTS